MIKIEGSIVALATPMLGNGDVDYASLAKLIDWHIESGTHGIVSVGTTGESATLTVDEHLRVIEQTIESVNGRIPVIAGTGANSTREAIELTKEAENLGADAALLVVPYYNKPTQEGLYQHYKAIADSVAIPQILYNVPGRTVTDMSNETVLRLADIDNIVAIKDATGDIERGKQLIDQLSDRMTVLSGDDPSAMALFAVGGRGDISVTANVAPKLMADAYSAALAGDMNTAETLDNKLQVLHRDLFVETSPAPVKYVLAGKGFGENRLRLPLVGLSKQGQAVVDAAMSQVESGA